MASFPKFPGGEKELEFYVNGSKVQSVLDKINTGVETLNGKLKAVRKTIEELGEKIAGIDEKSEALSTRSNVIDASEITKLHKEMQSFNTKMKDVNGAVDNMVAEANNPTDARFQYLSQNGWRNMAIAMAVLCAILLLILII